MPEHSHPLRRNGNPQRRDYQDCIGDGLSMLAPLPVMTFQLVGRFGKFPGDLRPVRIPHD